MVPKFLIYVAYALLFTCCYYVLNKRLPNKWILIGYPLFFCATIYPIKVIYDAIVPHTGKALAKEYLLLMLYAVSMIALFNFMYGIVNAMVSDLAGFQQQYGMPDRQPANWYISNRSNIIKMYQFFFYTGGMILYAVVVYKANIN